MSCISKFLIKIGFYNPLEHLEYFIKNDDIDITKWVMENCDLTIKNIRNILMLSCKHESFMTLNYLFMDYPQRHIVITHPNIDECINQAILADNSRLFLFIYYRFNLDYTLKDVSSIVSKCLVNTPKTRLIKTIRFIWNQQDDELDKKIILILLTDSQKDHTKLIQWIIQRNPNVRKFWETVSPGFMR